MVIIFMFVTYGLFGLFANIAVAINVAMIFGVLSLLNATLTLPGIAGIVLTVGIAVDSNVLIYERIREEVRAGRTPITAIDAGFTRALATILDSNITTFIAAAVLFFIGTGPVRGFAVTLGIGIITTVFTAFTLTRLIVAMWVRWWRPQDRADLTSIGTLGVNRLMRLLRIVPDDTKFDFMRFRRISFPVSALLSILAISLYFFHGLNFGIDFVGGTLIEVQSKSGAGRSRARCATTLERARSRRRAAAAVRRADRRADPRRAAAGRRAGAAGGGHQGPAGARRRGRLPPRRGGRARASRASCWPTARSAWCSRSSAS